jgi:hypothetical protein
MILMRVIRISLQQVRHAKVFRLTLMSDFLMVHSGWLSLLSVFFEMLFFYSVVAWPERYEMRGYASHIAPVFSVYAPSFLNYLNVKFFRNLEGALWEMCKKRRGTMEFSYFYVLAASG